VGCSCLLRLRYDDEEEVSQEEIGEGRSSRTLLDGHHLASSRSSSSSVSEDRGRRLIKSDR
jgi:hypothetical protein